jgi:hypothetical protein
MIIPEGTRLKLDPRDDANHEPEAAGNYNESMYFNAFSATEGTGAWMRIGNRPNEGHAEMTCCVHLPDGSVGFMYGRPAIEHNREMNAGPLRFDVLEPFRRYRVRYDGELLWMKNPLEMSSPGAAFKSNPRRPALIELELKGVTPVHGGEIVTLDGKPIVLDPKHSVFRGHVEQHLTAQGHITVDGVRHAIESGTAYRDKSWGPRHWHNFYWYRWLPVTFGPDFSVLLSIMGREGQEPFILGHVCEKGGALQPIRNVRMSTDWDDAFMHRAFTVTFDTDVRSFRLTGRVRSLIPLRHKPAAGADPDSYTRITEAMTEYHCDGHTTLGMSEFCDVMTGGIPLSHRLGWS